MPTAVEYALKAPWHTQNGCGSGPPNLMAVQNVALPDQVLPGTPSADGPLTGLFVAPLVLVAIVVAVRRRATRRSGRSANADVP